MRIHKRMLQKAVIVGLMTTAVSSVGVASASDIMVDGVRVGISNVNGQGAYYIDGNALGCDNITVSADNQSIVLYGHADNSPCTVTIDATGAIDLISNNNTALFLAGDHDNLHTTITYGQDMTVVGNSDTHGIAVASKGGSLTINGGKTFTVTAGENGVYARNAGAVIDITADNIAITSRYDGSNIKKSNAVYADSLNSQVNLTATDNIAITSANEKAVIATGGGAINIDGTADMTINGAVQADKDSSIMLKGNGISVTATGNGDLTEGAVRNADITATGKVTIDAKGDLAGVSAGVQVNREEPFATSNIKADEISVKSENGFGVYANDYGWHTVGTRDHIVLDANKITIDSKKDGLCVMNGAVATIKGFDTLNITSQEQGINSEFGNITVNGNKTHIISEEQGIRSLLGGKLTFDGSLLDIDAGLESIKLTGYSVMRVNTDVTQLDGDIVLNSDPNNGNPELHIKFHGQDSFLNGTVKTDDDAISHLTFDNGATWTNHGDSTVSTLVSNGGILDLGSTDTTVEIGQLSGKELTIKTGSLGDAVTVDSGSATTKINVEGNHELTLKIEQGQAVSAVLGDLANTVTSVGDSTNSFVNQVSLAEGNVLGAMNADVNADGSLGKIVFAENRNNAALMDMSALSLVTWRGEFDDLNRRLGDLRSSRVDNGIWTRYARGESSYHSVTNRASMYQIGYDRQAGDWTVGLAYSYTDGKSSYAGGTGENTHNVVSLYGTKMNANGVYLDLVAKYGNLDYEYDLRNGTGGADYDTDAYAFSAEVGKRITFSNGAWVEPQFQFTYGRVDSADFDTYRGVRTRLESIDSLVARAGVMAGKPFAKGDIYLRASYLYDFEGEVNGTFTNGIVSADINRDLGSGWWEVGVGTHVKLSDVTHFYLDFEKAFAGEVDTDWKWNAGVRYSF